MSLRFLLCWLALLTLAAAAEAGKPRVFTPDGAWCWFSDPRAVKNDTQLIAGWMTSDGSVQVGSRMIDGDDTVVAMLAEEFERDDHDHPALLVMPDGRVAAFYALHGHGDMHFRTTLRPRDITGWTPDRTLGFDDRTRGPRGVTYANPLVLRNEADSIYVFWRGADYKPTFSVSTDLGETWTSQRTLIHEPGRSTDNRPYVKYWSDGSARISFAFTDGHPRNEPSNGIYFARYERGAFLRADGAKIGDMSGLPLRPEDCDRVYGGETGGRAWVWSIVEDAAGNPVIGYTRLPAENDHRYHYARWDGVRWIDHEITPAGRWFPRTPEGATEPEPHYSGGMAIDPADPATVYLSRPADDVFEIEKWTTPDGGRTWTHEPVTENSNADNVRPVVVPGTSAGRSAVMWMRNDGGYRHYTKFKTSILLHQP